MSNNNYLDKVYTVGESDPDQATILRAMRRIVIRAEEGRSFMMQYLILQPWEMQWIRSQSKLNQRI